MDINKSVTPFVRTTSESMTNNYKSMTNHIMYDVLVTMIDNIKAQCETEPELHYLIKGI